MVLLDEQVVSVHWFEDDIGSGVHEAAPAALVTIIGQVVSVQLLEACAGSATQVPVGTLSVALTVQVRVV